MSRHHVQAYQDDSIVKCAAKCGSHHFRRPWAMHRADNPYLECLECRSWTQHPRPEFRYEAQERDGKGHLMPEPEKAANRYLANWLNDRLAPSSVLDVGSRFPYLLKCFSDLGATELVGVEGSDQAALYGEMLGVRVVVGDFMSDGVASRVRPHGPFDLVTLVHVIEHFPDVWAALRKAKEFTREGGAIFVRTPDVETSGIAHHLSGEHYPVHPMLFSRGGFEKLVASIGGMRVEAMIPQDGAGQFDSIVVVEEADSP